MQRAARQFWRAACWWTAQSTQGPHNPFVTLVLSIRLGPPLSLVLGGTVAIPRGSSYATRPPDEVPEVAALVAGGWIPYELWGWVMMAAGVAVVAGVLVAPTSIRSAHVVGIGHTVLAFCYLCLGFSSLSGAVLFGLPWAATGGYFSTVLLHFVRVWECFRIITAKGVPRRG